MSLALVTPEEMALDLASRIRRHRLERRWSRDELASRAQVASSTLRLFEQTGQISLPRLIRVAVALDLSHELRTLFTTSRVTSLDDLARPPRSRGRRVSP